MESLRRMVGYLGLKCKVKWVTRLPNNFKVDLIEVPLKLAIGEFQVLDAKMDILIGLVVFRNYE